MKTHLATRACASIGINGAVLNNVNAGAQILAGQGHPSRITRMVSVTNPGLDTNWSGHPFWQSN